MSIDRVEGLVYGVQDVETCTRFLDDWGMEKVEAGKTGAIYRTLENQLLTLRKLDDPGLPAAVEEGSTVREVVWGVDSDESLANISEELSRDREVIEHKDGSLHACDVLGIAIAFQVKDEAEFTDEVPVLNYRSHEPRLNRTMESTQEVRIRPYRIGHVVYNHSAEQREMAVAFYTERLNFRVTDAVSGLGDFLRCDGSTYHHNWFLLNRGDKVRFNHAAFEVKDFEQIILGGKYMRERGWSSSRNPGRHNLGSNLHWYFHSPLGGEVEYFSDMDRMDDNWKPRIWDKAPVIDFWKAEVL